MTTFDRDGFRAHLDDLHGDSPGFRQIFTLPSKERYTFTAEQLDNAVDQAAKWDRSGAAGIYVRTTTLATEPGPGQRGGADDALALPGLWADLDIAGPGHRPPTGAALPPDEAAARRIVAEAGLPDPTEWIHSGGGLYAWWLLDHPHLIGDDRAEVTALSTGWQAALDSGAKRLGWHYGTGVGDLARVLRGVGTVNRKVPGLDRPCRVLDRDGLRYPLDKLYAALRAVQPAQPTPQPRAQATPPDPAFAHVDEYLNPPGPFDALAAAAQWADIWPAGWTLVQVERDGAELWRRPGGTSAYSARCGRGGKNVATVFSTDAGLPSGEGQGLTKGRLFAHLYHGGDEKAAGRDLRAAAGCDPTASLAAQRLPRHVLAAIRDVCKLPTPAATPPAPPAPPFAVAPPPVVPPAPQKKLKLTRASRVRMRVARWLWEPDVGRIPLGELSLVAGRGNVGKSPFTLWIAGGITRGDLPGALHSSPRDVVIYAAEDSIEAVIVPRLVATKADLERVHFIEGTATPDNKEMPLDWRSDRDVIADGIRDVNAALLILDPLAVVYRGGTDVHNPQQMREALEPLVELGHTTGCTVLGLTHFNKGKGGDVAALLSQSHSLRDVARAVLVCAADVDDNRIVGQDKNNLGRTGRDVPCLTYEMESRLVPITDEDGISRLVEHPAFVITGSTDESLTDFIARATTPEPPNLPECAEWLFQLLAEHHPHHVDASIVRDKADEHGAKWDTVRKAATKSKLMRCHDARPAGQAKPKWVWDLTDAGAQTARAEGRIGQGKPAERRPFETGLTA